jgi:hypothetical protein
MMIPHLNPASSTGVWCAGPGAPVPTIGEMACLSILLSSAPSSPSTGLRSQANPELCSWGSAGKLSGEKADEPMVRATPDARPKRRELIDPLAAETFDGFSWQAPEAPRRGIRMMSDSGPRHRYL